MLRLLRNGKAQTVTPPKGEYIVNWQRWRLPLMLAPTMVIIIVLFVGSMGYSFLQSLGYQPNIGNLTLSLDAYASVMFSERYAQQFWQGLGLTMWVAAASTFASAALAIACALLLRQTFVGKKFSSFLFQLNLPVPHLVVAIGMIFLFSQSGLISRGGTALGLIERPNQFPIIVRDAGGIGIILTYIWKEVPFFGIIVLAILQSIGEDYEDLARSLGANRWQRFRHVLLPLIMPGLMSASIIVFAFTFGTYEVPKLLGVRFPEMLPVMALDFFLNPDLNSRAEGMALSMIIAVIVLVLVLIYMNVSNRAVQRS
jgi:putative spermidine/putrescine transport system permease protein